MGGSQSHAKGENWSGENQWRTYTLPRTGPRIYRNAPAHPDDRDYSCELLGIRPRFSRSHSLDEGRGVSPWALHHLQCADDQCTKPLERALTSTPLITRKNTNIETGNGNFHGDNRTGKCPFFNIHNENDNNNKDSNDNIQSPSANLLFINPVSQKKNDSLYKNGGCPYLQETSSNEDKYSLIRRGDYSDFKNIYIDEVDSCPKNDNDLFTSDNLKTPNINVVTSSITDHMPEHESSKQQELCNSNWAWVDEEDTSIIDHMNYDKKVYPCYNKSSSLDGLEDNRTLGNINIDDTHVSSSNKKLSTSSRDRKSEPSLLNGNFLAAPSVQDGRRHTLPSPRAGQNPVFLAPPIPLFDTLSWETLPPADELDIQLENKPIGCSIAENLPSDSIFPKSINSSFSDVSCITTDGSTTSTVQNNNEYFLVSPYQNVINNSDKYKGKTCSLPVEMRYIYSENPDISIRRGSINNSSTTILDTPLSSTPNAATKYSSYSNESFSPSTILDTPLSSTPSAATKYNSYSNETFVPTPVVIKTSDNCNIIGLIPKKPNALLEKNSHGTSERDELTPGTMEYENDSIGIQTTTSNISNSSSQMEGARTSSPTNSSTIVCRTKSNTTDNVANATTQTAPSDKHSQFSRLSSLIWISDERLTQDPCDSSLNLSYSEDDYSENMEERDTSDDEMESTSSPPATPTSFYIHDSSLSLSESLDTLDILGESECVPSPSEQYLQNYKFNNIHSSNYHVDLETSFQDQINKYISDNQYNCKCDLKNICNQTSSSTSSEIWIRREDRSTQTDPEQSPIAVLNECKSYLLEKGFQHNSILELIQNSKRYHESNLDECKLMDKDENYLHMRQKALPLLITKGAVGKTHSDPLKSSYYGSLKLKDDYYTRKHPIHSSAQDLSLHSETDAEIERYEVEASETCKWLRAAGFPQYAQMYEECDLFPVDLQSVERDHSFLDADSLQALFRRIKVLNQCANIRHNNLAPPNVLDSEDDEQQCALSENWKFQHQSRRWSRIVHDYATGSDAEKLNNLSGHDKDHDMGIGNFKRSGSERLKSHAKAFLRRMESLKNKKKRKRKMVIGEPKVVDEGNMKERVAEMGCVDISPDISPHLDCSHTTTARCIPHYSTSFNQDYQHHTPGEDSSSLASDQSYTSTPLSQVRRRRKFWPSQNYMEGDCGAYSDSECSPCAWRQSYDSSFNADSNGNTFKKLSLYEKSHTGASDVYYEDSSLDGSHSSVQNSGFCTPNFYKEENTSVIFRRDRRKNKESSLNSPDKERRSLYDNVPLVICNKSYQEYSSDNLDSDVGAQVGSSSECTIESQDSLLQSAHGDQDHNYYHDMRMDDDDDDDDDDMDENDNDYFIDNQKDDEIENNNHNNLVVPRRRVTVGRWHSFNKKSAESQTRQSGTQINHFSAGQMLHLRKRALLRLTALMERFCPSNRSGWNWELPKFIRKMKSKDYSDRLIFGVPLVVIAQRTGQPMPSGIQDALNHLRTNCLDQIGLFRKPGVRSRIQKLKELHENLEDIDYSIFGSFDIADMVKTYFRELPEVLLTNKLSEMFITIFQYLPEDRKLEALQCSILLLPDENREVLLALLTFLSDVAANSHLNQMHASNLSVCLTPSLFHLSTGRSGSSPLRTKSLGTPEPKDLHENKAARKCLTLMIQQVSQLQCVPTEMLANCHFTYLEQSQPVALEDLGCTSPIGVISSRVNWASYMEACISSLLKETRERSRGWLHINSCDPLVEMCYRKVGDGHPLRLWRVTTEVEAPPAELLNRVIRERHLWDELLIKWHVVTRLDKQAEVFQYMCNSMPPRPPVDYCVLRCWRNDLGRGTCVVVETSVEHCNAPVLVGGVRGIVLASRYLIQPCGSGKSRITNISRVDMRGRMPEWYNKVYGHQSAAHLARIRKSFQHCADGPESKV